MKDATRQAVFLTALALFSQGLGLCGSFSVNPVRIELSATKPNGTEEITNLGAEPVTVQARVVSWETRNNQDRYTDGDEVLLNPPIFSINPRQKQVMRFGLRRPNLSSSERAYRLILEEVPSRAAQGFVGVRTILRISIPIFALPPGHSAPQLQWKVESVSAGGLRLTARNVGNAHVQIKQINLTAEGNDRASFSDKSAVYLLPEQSKSWFFGGADHLSRVAISLSTDAGDFHEMLTPSVR